MALDRNVIPPNLCEELTTAIAEHCNQAPCFTFSNYC